MIDTSRSMIYHISNLNSESHRITTSLATGKAIEKGSDDAILHAGIINLEDKLRVTEGFKLQLDKTKALNDTADQNVVETKKALDAIKIDLMKSLNDGMDRSDKRALATNIEGIRNNLFDLVNSDIDGEFIFSGSDTSTPALIKDEDFNVNGKVEFGGNGFLRKIAVQPGSYRDRGVTAYDVVYQNEDKAHVNEQLDFSTSSRIIDENGNEWKLDAKRRNLQQYDYNGKLANPLVELPVTTAPSTQLEIDLGIGANTDAQGDFTITVNGIDYTHTAVAPGEDAATVFAGLKTALEADGYTVADSLFDDDKFILTNGTDMKVAVSETDLNYTIMVTNEQEGTEERVAVQPTFSVEVPLIPGDRVLESKHSYFDDLNIIINALEGYTTKLDGTRGEEIDNDVVDEVMNTYLGKTTDQFNATNIGHGELGGRNKMFEVAYERIEVQITHYNIMLTETSSADLSKLAMESKSLELTYQALYSTISKMNQLSLVNFMK